MAEHRSSNVAVEPRTKALRGVLYSWRCGSNLLLDLDDACLSPTRSAEEKTQTLPAHMRFRLSKPAHMPIQVSGAYV
jgi:hypothetical protein